MSSRKREHTVRPARRVLVLDVGGTHVKFRIGSRGPVREFKSGRKLSPGDMVARVLEATADWRYEAVSIGYPGMVYHGRIAAEPCNLGGGWIGFDFQRAFRKPVRVVNDAAMQAIGSYQGRRRLGARKWRRTVERVVEQLRTLLEVDYVVLGGGNTRKLKKLPQGARRGSNFNAFIGGVRLWGQREGDLLSIGTRPRAGRASSRR